MKLNYDQETDSLYIDLVDRPAIDSIEVVDGVVIDLDESGLVIGIDIQHASKTLDLSEVETVALPVASPASS
ncbi:MAG: DUF2283 domain-containing protein [Dehalococcoidia bacterium]